MPVATPDFGCAAWKVMACLLSAERFFQMWSGQQSSFEVANPQKTTFANYCCATNRVQTSIPTMKVQHDAHTRPHSGFLLWTEGPLNISMICCQTWYPSKLPQMQTNDRFSQLLSVASSINLIIVNSIQEESIPILFLKGEKILTAQTTPRWKSEAVKEFASNSLLLVTARGYCPLLKIEDETVYWLTVINHETLERRMVGTWVAPDEIGSSLFCRPLFLSLLLSAPFG